jgi:hypothetical protein
VAVVTGGRIIAEGGAVCSGFAFVDKVQDPWDGSEAIYGLYQSGNGTSGEFIDEASHNLHATGGDGTALLTPAIDDGVFCLSSQLFAGRHFIRCPRDSISVDQPFTVSCWAKLDDLGEDRSFFTIADDDDNWRFTMGYSFANTIRALVQTDDNQFMAWSINFLVLEKWYLFSAVWSPGNSLSVYVNGVLEATEPVTEKTLIAGGSFNKIGSFRAAGFPTGNIQDLRLYPVAKSAAWLRAEWSNICQPSFFSWGSVETLGADVSMS